MGLFCCPRHPNHLPVRGFVQGLQETVPVQFVLPRTPMTGPLFCRLYKKGLNPPNR